MRNPHLLLIGLIPAITGAREGAGGIDPEGMTLALTGVLIVFAGLAAVSLFIALLPKVLETLKPKPKGPLVTHTKPVPRASVGGLDDRTLAAITLVLQAEGERMAGSNLKVTLGFQPSPWALSNKMRVLPGRINT